ncbi:MAG: hypothetical protein D6806_11990, partial [Deltaproteobacteria bacterium]
HWSAHPRMFELAMRELSRQYGPGGELANSGPEAAELCARRLKLARDALLLLQDRNKRIEHRNEHVSVAMRCQSARLMEQKAEELLNRQKPHEAAELLEVAYELDPTPECKTRLETVRRYFKLQ